MDYSADNLYAGLAAQETAYHADPFIRVTHAGIAGSTAYGPVQITGTLAKEYLTKHKEFFSAPENDYLKRFVSQAEMFSHNGKMRGKITDYQPEYDYGGKGCLTNTTDKILYKQIAKKMIQDTYLKSKKNLKVFILRWCGFNDIGYTRGVESFLNNCNANS